jgi:NADPH:quinone reductase-like Zn-dependent oxidoreductase
MRAYEIGDQAGLGSLRRVERPDPVAGAGEVVIDVRAVCLNHRDLLIVSGGYGPRRAETRVPVSDGVGAIAAIGPGVTGWSLGDRVTCVHFAGWLGGAFAPTAFAHDLGVSHDGWLADKIVVPAAALVRVPDSLTDAQAAPLPAAGVTAWNALVEVGAIKAGDLVFALGTGGVSIFALQIAKLAGARVAITSSSDAKLEIARGLGADIAVNYATTPDWPTALMAANLPQSIAAAAPNGRIALIGALAGPPSAGLPNFSSILGKNLTLKGITEGSRAMLADLVKAASAGGLTPVIDRVFPFDDAPAAYAYLKSGAHLGKVMIQVSG